MGAIAELEPLSSTDRGALAKMVMTLLDHWGLSTEDQAALLGIAARAGASQERQAGLANWPDLRQANSESEAADNGGRADRTRSPRSLTHSLID